MSSSISAPRANKQFGAGHPVAKRLIQVAAQFVLIGAVLFGTAGQLDWVWGWVYLAASVVLVLVNAVVMPRELIAERGASKQNVKAWDKPISIAMMVFGLGIYITAGLDERFGWSNGFALALHLGGLVVFVAGNLLFTWAMVSNKFFSTAVRIQTERGQTVATQGPYRFVRHPGYVGYILFNLATPLLLGSWWAFVPAAFLAVTLIVRTSLEDATLLQELDGYAEYAGRVRYRLVPGVW